LHTSFVIDHRERLATGSSTEEQQGGIFWCWRQQHHVLKSRRKNRLKNTKVNLLKINNRAGGIFWRTAGCMHLLMTTACFVEQNNPSIEELKKASVKEQQDASAYEQQETSLKITACSKEQQEAFEQ
jgi:hypothetical protein